MGMRLLQAARLSKVSEASTGLDRQDADVRRYAGALDHEIVATATDGDVSGDTSPFKRPGLGPYLTDPDLVASYDGIIASHLDRLGRSVRHLAKLREWCEDHGKALITVEPPVDWMSDTGKLLYGIMAWLAEQELKAIQRRHLSTARYLRQSGYLSGKVPFGFRAVPVPDSRRKVIEPDPVTGPLLAEAVERYLAGETLAAICEWLDGEGIDAPGGPRWQPGSVSQLLRNPVLIGRQRRDDGTVVRDASGRPVQRCEPLIDLATWYRLQAKMDANPGRGKAPSQESLLAGLLYCPRCGGKMYRLETHPPKGKGRAYVYYRCKGTARQPSRCRNMVSLADVDAEVNAAVLANGHAPEVRREGSEPDDHSAELADVTNAIRELDLDSPDYASQHAALMAERQRIKELPPVPGRTRIVLTGRTVGEAWESLDTQGRREFLADHGCHVTAERRDGELRVTVGFAREPYASHREMAQILARERQNP